MTPADRCPAAPFTARIEQRAQLIPGLHAYASTGPACSRSRMPCSMVAAKRCNGGR